MITFSNVTKQYRSKNALNQFSLTIRDHELFVLVGPSGSGKTTLLKMINRLITPTSGTVSIDGQDVGQVADVRKLRQEIGYVLQAGALFPNMTVAENAAIQLDALHWEDAKKQERIEQLLKRVGLQPDVFMSRYPRQLSGGEAQRVGIVRALAAHPKLVLMDEPFSALDPLSRRQLQELVVRLHRELATTFVFVTHDMQEAIKLADRLAVIHNGSLQQVGQPADILANPANQFVANFFDDEEIRSQFLQQVLASGLGHPLKNQSTSVKKLSASDTIFTWAQLLQNQPQLLVQVDDKVLEPQDLITYMASLKGGVKS